MKKEDMQIQDLFDTSHTIAKLLFERNTYPWEILPKIGEYITSLGELLPEDEYNRRWERLFHFAVQRLRSLFSAGGS